jgi:thiol-disulfide isomerase/thioredoxin
MSGSYGAAMNRRPIRAIRATTLVAMLLLAACSAAPSATEPDPTVGLLTEAPSAEPTATEPNGSPDAPSRAPTGSPATSPSEAPSDPLLAVELTDVRTGEPFTLGELAADHGPVLVEPMAIWCTSCRAQQRQVVLAHESGSFTSVSLDVDLSEHPEDLAAYAEREGFDWRFAMADAALYRLLQERFGVAATNPPSTPLIVIETDGTVRALDFGVGIRSAEQILGELGAG